MSVQEDLSSILGDIIQRICMQDNSVLALFLCLSVHTTHVMCVGQMTTSSAIRS